MAGPLTKLGLEMNLRNAIQKTVTGHEKEAQEEDRDLTVQNQTLYRRLVMFTVGVKV